MAGSMRGLWKCGLGLLLGVLPLAALAEELPDPTRMPAEISAPVTAEAGAAQDSGLQSVIIAPGRRAAIINGQTVEQGGKYGNARLIKVGESSVVLRGPEGEQVLKLFPGVDMKKNKVQSLRSKPSAAKQGPAGKQAGKKAAVNAAPREEK
jgi:MSHA biogenesis protein MshK